MSAISGTLLTVIIVIILIIVVVILLRFLFGILALDGLQLQQQDFSSFFSRDDFLV